MTNNSVNGGGTLIAKSNDRFRRGVTTLAASVALATVLLSSLDSGEVSAREIQSYWPNVPPVQWVHPNNRVAILCSECAEDGKDLPAWILRLGSVLHLEGLDPVVVNSAPEEGDRRFVAILDPTLDVTPDQEPAEPEEEAPPIPLAGAEPVDDPESAPANHVAIVCETCEEDDEHLPGWVLRLASTMRQEGLEPVIVNSQAQADEGHYRAVLNPKMEAITDLELADEGPPPKPVPRFRIEEDGDSESCHAVLQKVLDVFEQPDPDAPRQVKVLVLTWRNVGINRRLFEQATWIAHYAKLDADFVDVSEIHRIPHRWLDRYQAVVLASSEVPPAMRGPLARMMESYLERGGKVAVLAGNADERLMSVLGVHPKWKPETKMVGFSCEPGWVPGDDGGAFALPDDGPEVVYPLEFDGPHTALCSGRTDGGDSVPLAVILDRGKGRVFYWNGVYLSQKLARGLIVLGLMELMAPMAVGLMDALVFYVDDNPRPMWDVEAPPVKELYGKTDTAFYRDIWWPQIRRVFEQYRIRPTFAFILSYNDRVAPPFATESFDLGSKGAAGQLARTILSNGYEVAIHGYNHQSFSVGKSDLTVGWPGRDVMEESLRVARRQMIRILNSETIPTVYVAPGNFIQKLGKEAVLRAFPEVSAIATVYQGWRAIMGSEFAQDPMLEGVMNLPRISAGYGMNVENRREMVDALVSPGVFSHFIHSDDIYDPGRSQNVTFEEMVYSLGEMLKVVTRTYPFLRRMPASRFAESVREYLGADIEVRQGPDSLVVQATDAPPGGLTTFLRLPPGYRWSAVGCEILFQSIADRRTYLRLGDAPCELRFEPVKED